MPSPDKDIRQWNRDIYNARSAGQDEAVAKLKCKITERIAMNKQLREDARRARVLSSSGNTTRQGENESVSLVHRQCHMERLTSNNSSDSEDHESLPRHGGSGSSTDHNMTSDCSESGWGSDEEKTVSHIMKRARNTQNGLSGGTHTSNSSTEISSLVPHAVGALGPLGHISGIPATVQTFLWENSTGVNEFIEAVLTLKSHNSDEKRKKTAFINEEKRKQELHELQKRTIEGEKNDETDIEGEPALVSRMKRLLEIFLPEDTLAAMCKEEGCVLTVSPFRFAVIGECIDELRVCCVTCARQSERKLKQQFVMEKEKVLTWLTCAGANRKMTCAICEVDEHKIDLIWGDWQKAHIRSNNCCGENKYGNKFPSHGFCNREQHTRNLFEIRKCSKLSDTPFPNRMSVEEAEAFLENNI